MNKKKLILILLTLLVLIGAGLAFIFKDNLSELWQKNKVINPIGDKQTNKPEIKFDLTDWQDLAGFSFQYPKEVSINDYPEEETHYSHLELTNKEIKGKIIIICDDSQYADLDDWLSKDELVSSGAGLDTQVASVSAKKVALKNGREITGLIDWDEVIYIIDLQSEGKDYWRQVYNQILASFKLIPLKGESQADFNNWFEGFDTSQADVVESVEIIE